MKIIRLLFLALFATGTVFGQSSDATLTTQANVIRNETVPKANTAARVANMFQGLIDSKVSILAPRLTTTSTTGFVWTATDNLGNGGWSAASGGGHTILNSGTPLTTRTNLNFTNGLTASDNNPNTDVKLGGVITEPSSLTATNLLNGFSYYADDGLQNFGFGTSNDNIILTAAFTTGTAKGSTLTVEPEGIVRFAIVGNENSGMIASNDEISFENNNVTGNYFKLIPTFDTNTHTGTTFIGIDWNPTILVAESTFTHIAFRAVTGRLLIGGSTITSNSVLADFQSTTQAVKLATAASASIASPTAGMLTSDSGLLKYYDGSIWHNWWSLVNGGTLTGANTITGTGRTLKGVWNSLGVTQTNGYGWWLANTTAAAAGAQQISPSLVLEGQGWQTNTSGSQSVKFKMDVLPVQGAANPTGNFAVGYSINGASYTNVFTIKSSAATLSMETYGLILNSGGVIRSDAGNKTRIYWGFGSTGEVSAGINGVIISASAYSSAWVPTLTVTPGAHTSMTAATEFISNDFQGASLTWLDGTTATQRFNYFRGYTLNKTTTSATFTNAYNLYVDDLTAGTGVTITNKYALGVNGATSLTGSGATSATYALKVFNSTPARIFAIRNDATMFVGNVLMFATNSGIGGPLATGNNIVFQSFGATTSGVAFTTISAAVETNATGDKSILRLTNNSSYYAPTTGTGTFTGLVMTPTYNMTGTSSATIYGINYNPTVTAIIGTHYSFRATSGNQWFAGKTIYDATITAGGTTGNQTIDKPSGTVNIAAAGTTVTVTNSFCTTSSIVTAVVRTNDATAYIKNVVPGAGSFVINLGAAATAEVSIGFIVNN